MEANITMFVVSHKEFNIPKDGIYTPIYVGSKQFDTSRGVRDDEGISIAGKNSSFCELTALYWIWKNDVKSDYIGFCHYRRYFTRVSWNSSYRFILNKKDIMKLMASYDIVLPERQKLKCTVREMYYKFGEGKEKDLDAVRQILSEIYPKYIDDFDSHLDSNRSSYCNMAIMGRGLLDSYCKWLFDILFEAERRIDISDYTRAEARVFGYLSEILLNVWVIHNKLSAGYQPIVQTDIDGWKLVKQYIRKRMH